MGLSVAALVTWLVTASLGACMLGTWLARGGLRERRATGHGPPPGMIFGHAGLALTGLCVWVSFLVTGWDVLAWAAAGLLMPVVGLGVATVTLWTPFPDPELPGAPRLVAGPGAPRAVGGMLAAHDEDVLARRLTDEVLARALTDDALARRLTEQVLASLPADPAKAEKKPRGHLAPLIPAGHGVAAVTTVLLAVLSAVGKT